MGHIQIHKTGTQNDCTVSCCTTEQSVAYAQVVKYRVRFQGRSRYQTLVFLIISMITHLQGRGCACMRVNHVCVYENVCV